jgi:hypothetical protein
MKTRITTLLALLLVAGLGAGCKSIWDSITSPSDSISGTANSISGSFEAMSDGISQSCSGTKPSSSDLAYGEEVRVFALSFVRAGEPVERFASDLARVAERHGVLDYRAETTTWHALGVGLAQAGLDAHGAEAFLAEADLAGGADHVREGVAAVL